MPGITAWFPSRPDPRDGLRFRAALELMTRENNQSAVVDVEHAHCLIGHASYPGYPLRVWKERDFTLVFEGHAYGHAEPALRRDLALLAQRAFARAEAAPIVSQFVQATDGDFLVVLATADRCIAFGDALGRLPVYVQRTDAGILFARECKFAAAMNAGWSFDRIGVAQHLWLGYPLGERTLFEGIERAAEGFFLDVERDARREPLRARTYSIQCDRKDSRSLSAAASDLTEQILTATRLCASVQPELPPIVSLSGGYDSRSVLAGVRRARPDCIAATFRRPGGRQAADVRIAEQIARSLGVRWECVDLDGSAAAAEERLVWMKDGLNYTAMTFIVAFLDEIVRRWSDRAVLLTGDGGDKIFPDLRPARRASSFDNLALILVDESMLMPEEEIEGLLGLSKGSLIEGLRNRLTSYPEQAFDQKAVHWKIAERSRKWLFEGEDRNRCFLWQASPCLSLSVFEAAMRVNDEHKSGMRLYAEVQRRLDPALLQSPHADSGMWIDSARARAHAFARRWALRAVGPLRRPIVARWKPGRPASAELRLDTLERLERALSSPSSKLARLLQPETSRASIERASRASLDNWRTLLCLDRLWTERIGYGVG